MMEPFADVGYRMIELTFAEKLAGRTLQLMPKCKVLDEAEEWLEQVRSDSASCFEGESDAAFQAWKADFMAKKKAKWNLVRGKPCGAYSPGFRGKQ